MKEKARCEAQEVLNTYWEKNRFPVDPAIIAKKLRITVKKAILPPEVSGAIIKNIQTDAVILISATDSDYRQRFTIAHELGHFVFNTKKQSTNEEYDYIDLRDANASSGADPEEVFANNFAANLLMPEAEFLKMARKFVSDLDKIHLSKHFGVSIDAIQVRKKNLNLLVL